MHGKSQRPPPRNSPRSLPEAGDTAGFCRQRQEGLCVKASGVAHPVRHGASGGSHRDHKEGVGTAGGGRAGAHAAARQCVAAEEETMSTNGPPDCHRCGCPIPKGSEVLLNKKLFHAACAVAAVKEKKHGSNTDDTRRGEQGEESGFVSRTDAARN